MSAHPVDCDDGWITCPMCDGEGSYHDCGDDTCCCADPWTDYVFDRWECHGEGGVRCPVCQREGHDASPARRSAERDAPKEDR